MAPSTSSALTTIPVVTDTLRFFKDDGTSEESAGAVSCIRVYSGALTDAEVCGDRRQPDLRTRQRPSSPPAAAETTKKKCKKHKKKHRSAESAKKKCKKKKKR